MNDITVFLWSHIREFNSEDTDNHCKEIPDLFDPENKHWRHAVHRFSLIILATCAVYALIMVLTTTRMCVRKKITLETKITLVAKYLATSLIGVQLILFLSR